jgi:type II secretory pathway pseudopilin PulG
MRITQRLRHQDAGTTLAETIVVAVIGSLMGLVVVTTVIGGMRTSARAETRTDDIGAAQSALLQISADLRAAVEVKIATATQVQVVTRTHPPASQDPMTTAFRVTYVLATSGDHAGELSRTRESACGVDCWQASDATTVLMRDVVVPVDGTTPVFTYLGLADAKGQCTTGPTASTLAPGGAVADLDLGKVVAVEVWLSVNSSKDPEQHPVTLSGGATLAKAGALGLGAAAAGGRAGIGQGCA